MTRYTPLWLQSGSYAASVDRRLMAALWPTARCDGMAVAFSAGMTVTIAPGNAAVPTPNSSGVTLCVSDAQEQLVLPAAPASGQNRYDLVVVRPRGTDLDGGVNNDFIFDFVSGAPAASNPPFPGTPAGCLALANILQVGGSAAITPANIFDARPSSLAIGATVPDSTPRGYLAGAVGPAVLTDFTSSGGANPVTVNFNAIAGRRYRVEGIFEGTQVSASGNSRSGWILSANCAMEKAGHLYSWNVNPCASGQNAFSTAGCYFRCTASGPASVAVSCVTSAGAFRVQPNTWHLGIEDVGTF